MNATTKRYRQRERVRKAIGRLMEVMAEVYGEEKVLPDEATASMAWMLVEGFAPLLRLTKTRANMSIIASLKQRRRKQSHWSAKSRGRKAAGTPRKPRTE